ncbi:hypothetical protein [Variovorax sp. GT1P44]|uniref:hypothetical protein n=1 Tax=Variovorax sp. GT1P44 TaxID=3443742 RepID=UPI003F48E4B9
MGIAPSAATKAAGTQKVTQLAVEGEVFTVSTDTMVRFGSGTNWVSRSVPPNMATMCHQDVFGDPGVPAPRVCETGTEDAAVVDGAVGPSQQNGSMAAQLSKEAGIDYRFGPSAAAYGVADAGLPLLYKRADTRLTSPDYQFFWQVGGPPSGNAGAYSTNQANALFVPDNPGAAAGKGGIGVTDFQVTGYMYNVFAQSPQLSWTVTAANGGGLDSLNAMAYKAAGTISSDPVAMARCAGRPGFCAQALVAFQNGVIGTVGSNTASNDTTVKLPANKVPTGIAMTNDSEFALVTVWDTSASMGQVAVIALAGLCDGCDPYNNGTNGKRAYYDWWHEWMGTYPGLPNMGNIAFMKILGYVDLPGMTAPTDIAVTTGMDQFGTVQVGGNFMGLDNSPLSNNWQKFASGGENYGRYAKGGVAVVTSKSEQKAAFIDLKPLFSYFNGTYFSSNVSSTGNLGQADGQWPYTFTQQPSQAPTVIKTVALAAQPTAVKTTVSGNAQRAWIATQDGTLHIYSLGGYAPGGAVALPAASAIAEVGTVGGIGRNPTSLATSKGEPGASIESINQQVIVASRGDRKISWVRFAGDGNSGSIVRTFQDQRLKDPVAVEDSDNFANAGYVLSVADYADKSIKNFRYGPVTFSEGGACPKPNGCPVTSTGGVQVEYGGSLALPGKPFQITTANVP